MTTKEGETKTTAAAKKAAKEKGGERGGDEAPLLTLANSLRDAWKDWVASQAKVHCALLARVAKVQANLADEYQETHRDLWKPVKDAHERLQEAVWTGDAQVWEAHKAYSEALLKFQCAQRQAQIDSQRSFEEQAKNAYEETQREWGEKYSGYLEAVQTAWARLDPKEAGEAALAAQNASWPSCA